jgi:hypothetical protein
VQIRASGDTMLPMLIRFASCLLLSLLAGCSTDTLTFSVSVKNDTEWPITLNLAKSVPQTEELWASPEDLDTNRVLLTPNTRLGMVDVPPGKTGTVTNVSGHFSNGARAILRVYRGKNLLQKELLNMKVGADRQDVDLKPGENRFVVHDEHGKLSISSP